MAAVRIKIDIKKVQQMLGRVQSALRDRRGLLTAIAEWMRLTVRRSFEQQRSPEGRPWRSLSQPYGRIKQGITGGSRGRGKSARGFGGKKKLQFTGVLFRSVRGGVTENVAFIGSNVLYAGVHQFGHTFPAMTITAKSSGPLRFFDASLNAIYARRVQIGPRRVPARPFLPSLVTVEREAIKIVDEHLEDATREKN